jgi:hypothetical protein
MSLSSGNCRTQPLDVLGPKLVNNLLARISKDRFVTALVLFMPSTIRFVAGQIEDEINRVLSVRRGDRLIRVTVIECRLGLEFCS